MTNSPDQILVDLIENLEYWQRELGHAQREVAERQEKISSLTPAIRGLIQVGRSTGDRFKDIALGVHGSLDPRVAEDYREIERRVAACVGQPVLRTRTTDEGASRICHLKEPDDSVRSAGLMPPSGPLRNHKMWVGLLSGGELIFDRQNLLVCFPTSDRMVSCIVDHFGQDFAHRGEPKIESENLGAMIYPPTTPIIGNEEISLWFKANLPAANNYGGVRPGVSVWDRIMATFNPTSASPPDVVL